MIKHAELTLYDENFDSIELELSPIQLKTIVQILGINFQNENSYNCHTDETLMRLFEDKGNPLKLKPID